MQRITTFLWFDKNAEEAARFYTSLFPNSRFGDTALYGESGADIPHRPASGSVMTISFQLDGQDFVAMNGGPAFKFTSAISLFVSCNSEAQIDELFKNLSAGGSVLMPINKYPWSEKYAWVSDKFGVSWQLNLAPRKQMIAPSLMFVNQIHGKAEEAIKFYMSCFDDSNIEKLHPYEPGDHGVEGTLKQGVFKLAGQEFRAFDSHMQHEFGFNPAISFVVNCSTQNDVDDMWTKLSAGGQIVECGWLADKYGVSWQVVPTALPKMLQTRDAKATDRVMKAIFQMKKLDIATLEQAFRS